MIDAILLLFIGMVIGAAVGERSVRRLRRLPGFLSLTGLRQFPSQRRSIREL